MNEEQRQLEGLLLRARRRVAEATLHSPDWEAASAAVDEFEALSVPVRTTVPPLSVCTDPSRTDRLTRSTPLPPRRSRASRGFPRSDGRWAVER